MLVTPGQHLVNNARRFAALVVRGIIFPDEFISSIFDDFAYAERVYPEVVPELWGVIPDSVRSKFVEAIRDATRPDFRYPPFYIGGSRPQTEEELRRDADLRTARVQAWACEFVKFFDGIGL
jgi:hypothetical protein